MISCCSTDWRRFGGEGVEKVFFLFKSLYLIAQSFPNGAVLGVSEGGLTVFTRFISLLEVEVLGTSISGAPLAGLSSDLWERDKIVICNIWWLVKAAKSAFCTIRS